MGKFWSRLKEALQGPEEDTSVRDDSADSPEQTETTDDDVQESSTSEPTEFETLVEPVFWSLETCLSNERFSLCQARLFVLTLRSLSDDQRKMGCCEDSMEPALLSRALKLIQELEDGVKQEREVYDPRQTMTFLYCVLSVFPSSARLITGTCLTAQLSEKGKEVHSKFDTLQYYCDLKTFCEKSDGIKHQQQLLDLALWLETDRPAVSQLIISRVICHVSSSRRSLTCTPTDPFLRQLEHILQSATIQTSGCLAAAQAETTDDVQESSTSEPTEFETLIEPVFWSLETCLSNERFSLCQARPFVLTLRSLSDDQRKMGCCEDSMEPALLSRALKTIKRLEDGLTTGTCGTHHFSEKGKEAHNKLDKLQYYCDLKTVCEKSDGLKNYVQHQHQLLDLAVWLETDRPPVSHLIIARVICHLAGLSAGHSEDTSRHSAEHQEVISAEHSGRLLRKASQQVTQEAAQQVTQEASQQVTQEASQQVTQKTSEQDTPRNVLQVSEQHSNQMSQKMSPQVTQQGSSQGAQKTYAQIILGDTKTSQKSTHQVSQQSTDKRTSQQGVQPRSDTNKQVPKQVSPQGTQNVRQSSKHSAQQASPQGTKQVVQKKVQKAFQRASEKTSQQVHRADTRNRTTDEQDTEALTEEQTENLNWFEKSVGVLRSGAARDSMDLDVELQDEQLAVFRRGGRKGKFYDTLIEDPDELQKLLNNPDEYKRCRLRIESSHRSKAQVLDKDSEVPEIVITGRSKCGQTYMDDEVVVQIVGASAQQTGRSNSASATPANASGCVTYGRVVGLLKRVNFAGVEHPQFFCTLDELQSYLMKPLCKTVPKIHVMNDTLKRKHPSLIKHRVEIKQIGKDGRIRFKEFFNIVPGMREQYIFKVVLVVWSLGNIYPLGAVLGAFTGGKDCTSGIRLLSLREKVPNTYPQAVVRETSGLPTDPRPRMEGRINLIKRRMFTIDSPGSKDLDDALSVWKHEKHTVVGVHIADVAAVIQEGQAIDNEARKRGVTFYPLLREPHHMLPEPLSTDRCSLLPNKERLALSVLFKFNDSGEQVGNPTVKKTLIKSSQQLAYQEVQAIITGASAAQANSDLEKDIITLHQIATKLRKDRLQNSILFVPFEDPRLSKLEDVKNSVEAHALVEEFMILANSYIAERLLSKFPQLMILRRQKAPTYEQLVEWRDKERGIGNLVMQLQGKNVTPDTKLCFSTGTCNPEQDVIIKTDIWEALCRHLENGHLDKARRIAFMDDMHPLQCLANSHWMDLMETSEYKCSYGLNAPDRFHFGLNRVCYTHFTSPIRRYADLHVHRLLHADLDGQTPSCTPDDVTALCHHINSATKRQRAFGNGCLSLKIAESLQHQPLVFRTFVDQVDSEQLTLMVPSLRAVFSRKQEVPFSILGVSSQPELLPDETQTGKAAGVSVKWKMRIYNERMTCPLEFAKVRKAVERLARSSPTLPLVFNINPHYLSVSVEQEEWADILHKLIQSTNPERVAVPSTIERASQDVNYMTSEKDDGTVSLRPCHFKMKLSPGQVLQVQMSAEPQKGVLQPRVDLVHTARNASVCTRHVRDPVLTLSRPATRSTRRTHFSNYKDYACAWMPLLEMEAAYGAGGSDEGVVIENVNLAVAPQNVPNASRVNYTVSFSLSAKFCFDRCIEFGGKSPDTADEEKPKSKGAFPLDYLCIRYQIECPGPVVSRVKESPVPEAVDRHYTWVGHAGVIDVTCKESKGLREKEMDIHVTCELSHTCPPPPQSLTQGPKRVTVELLPKSAVERRAQESLVLLKRDHEKLDLAKAIAHNNDEDLPPLESEHLRLGQQDENHEVGMKFFHDQTETWKPLLPQNNSKQHEAIKTSLTNSLSLIQGPPGTGKTCTGVKLVYLFCKINRQLEKEGKGKKTVLFCGPSNKSVDLVARYLIQKLRDHCPKIVRMYGSAIESKDYPVPRGGLSSSRSTRDLKSDPELVDVTLHHVIRQEGKPFAEKLQQVDRLFEECRKKPDSFHLDSKVIKNYRRLLYKASVEELQHYEVVLTTCAVGGNRKLVKGTKGTVFQVIIDECAMSPEPHSLVPIIATKARQVVLIGDHKQLRPIITCQAAADLGLDQSLFERLYEQYPANTVFLDTQYRMHRQICEFPSQEFYEGGLITKFKYQRSKEDEEDNEQKPWWMREPLPFWPYPKRVGKEVPHLLVDVRGQEESLSVSTEEGNEKSKSNAAEVEKVMEIVSFLKTCGVELQNIKVLTQYNAQRHQLEQRMKQVAAERAMGFTRYDSSFWRETVSLTRQASKWEGGEWDYVILSTVRSLPSYKIEPNPTHGWCRQNLGFITDRNQVNVALTRARKGLIIVGNKELLRCDDVWRNLVDRYSALGCVRDASFPPPPVVCGQGGRQKLRPQFSFRH
ncbi:hypothetical protein BaRGS_00018237 [Batillaria attramentaria]|uniref:RNB domain-containing protein n=1 Tax=Batillaria attramentaria TaxID=370345 RepID=A0ABD0KT54_9CAEN